ncbi:MAG: glycosyltransferase family 1 protein [Motiliproteus sp.]|nr:glycosyltransferase family 1 protein [Motiliproteus sp.]MCW9053962.1 glycosyltransferase family 1 protein [Motiliproteus sp.]
MDESGIKKLVIVTDAWFPQTNGVVTTLSTVSGLIADQDIETTVIHPGLFWNLPVPGYPEIRMAINTWKLAKLLDQQQPDFVHIATEAALGMAARKYMIKRGLPFTTSLHTRFPEYINERLPFVPVDLGYRFLRWFHNPAQQTLVTTPSLERELQELGFEHMKVWGRGVDLDLYQPRDPEEHDMQEPLMLYVGRVAIEKNLRAFLDLRIFGKKIVVGDGPSMAELKKDYPEVLFTGYRYGEELAREYARADVFVFPSLTDTFGLVMLEAMACGTPVAAYPVTGPIDVVKDGLTGALDDDLEAAIKRALQIPRDNCRAYALEHSWRHCADIFAKALVPIHSQGDSLDLSQPVAKQS